MGPAGALLPTGIKPGPSAGVDAAASDGRRTRTGAHWRDVPERYGPWDRVYDLFRWQRDGTWARILTGLQAEADAKGLSTWEVNVDSTVCRAHRHAAGAAKKGTSGPGCGLTDTFHLAVEQGQTNGEGWSASESRACARRGPPPVAQPTWGYPWVRASPAVPWWRQAPRKPPLLPIRTEHTREGRPRLPFSLQHHRRERHAPIRRTSRFGCRRNVRSAPTLRGFGGRTERQYEGGPSSRSRAASHSWWGMADDLYARKEMNNAALMPRPLRGFSFGESV
ncbi:transposase [Streptomyces sp. NPDC047821]|uniref:transposase n=1 Tax=Streptomyces sp. NPDC047821 TaxID=3365488 RepID=UPI00371AAD2E